MNRVVAYIDGFNLYYGLKESGCKRYYWLDVVGLVSALLKPEQSLEAVHYFTARICADGSSQESVARQAAYLDALGSLPLVTKHFGQFLGNSVRCHNCGHVWQKFEEKMTDVNIASRMLSDAFEDCFDTALLVSADSDLTMPIRIIQDKFPGKKVIVAQPPRRASFSLRNAAAAVFTIGKAKLRQNQLPDRVVTSSGHVVCRPEQWK